MNEEKVLVETLRNLAQSAGNQLYTWALNRAADTIERLVADNQRKDEARERANDRARELEWKLERQEAE